MEETKDTIKISVSDPSMLNDTGIDLRLDGKKLQVLNKPDNVVVKTTELMISKGKKSKAGKSEKTQNNNESINAKRRQVFRAVRSSEGTE
jgi:hypothetical protein